LDDEKSLQRPRSFSEATAFLLQLPRVPLAQITNNILEFQK
jgi:hypothetical protein